MALASELMDLDAIFKHLFNLLRSKTFLDVKEGYGDVPFFICPFDPSYAQEVPQRLNSLMAGLKEHGVECLHIDLYKLCLEILKKDDTFDLIAEQEKELRKTDLSDIFAEALSADHVLKPAIVEKLHEADSYNVIMLSGVGEVYPYVRVHSLLASLEVEIIDHPLVVLFPGKYIVSPSLGSSLELFGLLKNDRYYRATNILDLGSEN